VDTGADCRGLVALANLAAVRLYGEIEFWFAMIKVTTIIVMIVVGWALFSLALATAARHWLWQPDRTRRLLCRRLEGLPDGAVYRCGVLSGRGAYRYYRR
jgi:hypothetical protein